MPLALVFCLSQALDLPSETTTVSFRGCFGAWCQDDLLSLPFFKNTRILPTKFGVCLRNYLVAGDVLSLTAKNGLNIFASPALIFGLIDVQTETAD